MAYSPVLKLCRPCREVTFGPQVWTQAWTTQHTLSDRACSMKTLQELRDGLAVSCWFCEQIIEQFLEELNSTMEQWFSCHAQPNFEIQITVYKSMKQNEVSFSLTNYTSWDPEEHLLPSHSDNAIGKTFTLPLFADPGESSISGPLLALYRWLTTPDDS